MEILLGLRWKKKIFTAALLVGAAGCVLLGFLSSWLWFLGLFVIAKSAYSLSLVFYDSMLVDVTEPDRMDEVSARGYGWGYIGSCIPFVLCLLLVLFYDSIGLTMSQAMAGAFLLTALWWVGFSLPLVRSYRQKAYVEKKSHYASEGFRRLAHVFGELKEQKKVLYRLPGEFLLPLYPD